MRNLEAIFRAIHFMEAHLKEEVTIADTAHAAGYSLYHFIRLFNEVVGHSPYDYMIRRRLSEAAQELLETEENITTVAFTYQFGTLENFSRAFKKMFGVPPHKFKSVFEDRVMVFKTPATDEYLEHIYDCGFFSPTRVFCQAFSLIGNIRYGISNDNSCIEPYLRFNDNKTECMKDDNNSRNRCAVVLYPLDRAKGPICIEGFEAPNLAETPSTFVGKTIPDGPFVAFTHSGGEKYLEFTFQYIFETWFPKSGCTPADSYAILRYPWGKSDDITKITVMIPIREC